MFVVYRSVFRDSGTQGSYPDGVNVLDGSASMTMTLADVGALGRVEVLVTATR